MYLTSFTHAGQLKYGFLTQNGQSVVDAQEAEKRLFEETLLPGSLIEVIETGEAYSRLKEINRLLQDGGDHAYRSLTLCLKLLFLSPDEISFALV